MARQAVAPYAERLCSIPGAFDLAATSAWGAMDARWSRQSRIGQVSRQIKDLASSYVTMSDTALRAEAAMMRPALLRDSAKLQPRVFALVHAAVERHLGLRYHPVQLAGGRALTGRRIVEMATGEGKTITAALPAAAAALAGRPVHVVTVNDYLAERDLARLRPVYEALGLSVGLVKQGDEPQARRVAYAADITYVTNKELTFDYLKDRIATSSARGNARHRISTLFGAEGGGLLLRGLHVAVIDEADSVLIDEARTPLIISAERGDTAMAEMVGRALAIAGALAERDHYMLDPTQRTILLTSPGRGVIADRSAGFTGLFRAQHAREQFITQALTALHLFDRDRHYIIADGKVQIIDEYTGRTMPDRSWEQGLHQLVEAKEGVALTGARETLARITYQRFFNRYLHLSGMTGTAREVAGELRAVYGLRVVRLPTNRPLQRHQLGGTLVRDQAAKWQTVADRIEAVQRVDRPVLVGTPTVEASEALGLVLATRGIDHVVLNARQDAQEADIVAAAGAAGRVTVSTNMAGRGTDIELGPGVAKAGGLHVILTSYHDSTRIDRQLFGRAGRQGDPGSCESVVSLDDDLFQRFARRLASLLATTGLLRSVALPLLRWRAQTAASGNNAQQRRFQVLSDERQEKQMGFAGRE